MRIALLLVLACGAVACSRTLRSCAAHIIVIGPTLVTLACPPPGFPAIPVESESSAKEP